MRAAMVAEREAVEGLAGAVQAAAGEGEADGWVVALQALSEGGEASGGGAQAAGCGGVEAVAEVVEALAAAADEGL